MYILMLGLGAVALCGLVGLAVNVVCVVVGLYLTRKR
jgi:hypothetical protein